MINENDRWLEENGNQFAKFRLSSEDTRMIPENISLNEIDESMTITR